MIKSQYNSNLCVISVNEVIGLPDLTQSFPSLYVSALADQFLYMQAKPLPIILVVILTRKESSVSLSLRRVTALHLASAVIPVLQ